MESGGQMNDADRIVDERFRVMADFDAPNRGWQKDQWYHAVPPIAAKGRAICMVDYFGRTLVAGLPKNVHDVVLTGHSYGGMVITGVMDRVPERIKHVVFLDAAVPDDGMSLWDLFGGPQQDPSRFADGFMPVPWVRPDAKPPHNVKQSIKCFNQPVSYKNPAALALPVTYVAFVPKDKSIEERAATDKSWQRAKARGWTIRTFPGGHVAQQEDPRGVATLMAEAVKDRNQPVAERPAATPAAK
jgi:pimeloyl-ACP methyl ester carboxylesterase